VIGDHMPPNAHVKLKSDGLGQWLVELPVVGKVGAACCLRACHKCAARMQAELVACGAGPEDRRVSLLALVCNHSVNTPTHAHTFVFFYTHASLALPLSEYHAPRWLRRWVPRASAAPCSASSPSASPAASSRPQLCAQASACWCCTCTGRGAAGASSWQVGGAGVCEAWQMHGSKWFRQGVRTGMPECR
jgi:hypothetical protein